MCHGKVMYYFTKAALTEHHGFGGLNTKIYFLTVLEVKRLTSRCKQDQFLLRPLFLAYRWPSSPPCVFMRFSSVCVYAPISSYYKNKNHIGLESIAMISFNFNYFFKDPIYKHSLVLKYWGLGLQHISFRERHNQSLPEFKKKKKKFFSVYKMCYSFFS